MLALLLTTSVLAAPPLADSVRRHVDVSVTSPQARSKPNRPSFQATKILEVQLHAEFRQRLSGALSQGERMRLWTIGLAAPVFLSAAADGPAQSCTDPTSFGPRIDAPAGIGPKGIAFGDFDRDGDMDLSLLLGDGSAAIGAPTLDTAFNLVYVGSDAGIVYAVQLPLP